jgi:hypothetical protein
MLPEQNVWNRKSTRFAVFCLIGLGSAGVGSVIFRWPSPVLYWLLAIPFVVCLAAVWAMLFRNYVWVDEEEELPSEPVEPAEEI